MDFSGKNSNTDENIPFTEVCIKEEQPEVDCTFSIEGDIDCSSERQLKTVFHTNVNSFKEKKFWALEFVVSKQEKTKTVLFGKDENHPEEKLHSTIKTECEPIEQVVLYEHETGNGEERNEPFLNEEIEIKSENESDENILFTEVCIKEEQPEMDCTFSIEGDIIDVNYFNEKKSGVIESVVNMHEKTKTVVLGKDENHPEEELHSPDVLSIKRECEPIEQVFLYEHETGSREEVKELFLHEEIEIKSENETMTPIRSRNSHKKCCVPSCKGGGDSLSFHKFPSKPDLRNKWIKAIYSDKPAPNERAVVCSLHFEANNYKLTSSTRRKLKCDVVPTIFPVPLPLPLTPKVQKMQEQES